jgi:hypothetical protein
MSFYPDQPQRQARLLALVEDAEFAGRRVTLGQALGFRDGAYIRQLIEGERPISERLIERVHSMRGGKFRGWFDVDGEPDKNALSGEESDLVGRYRALTAWRRQAAFNAFDASPKALEMAQIYDSLPPKLQDVMAAMANNLLNVDPRALAVPDQVDAVEPVVPPKRRRAPAR